MADATLRVFRGNKGGGQSVEFKVPVAPGMVVLDALHYIQGHLAQDLAVRWNCKAGKCGSCSAEVNGRPGRIGSFTRTMWIACRSFASASSVFCARTSAMFCEIMTNTSSSAGRDFLCAWRDWRCIR